MTLYPHRVGRPSDVVTEARRVHAVMRTHSGMLVNAASTLALQVFNNTPDETAFYRLCLNREDVGGALTMIQPTLQSYGFDGPPTPVRTSFSHPSVAFNAQCCRATADLAICTTLKPAQSPSTSHQPAGHRIPYRCLWPIRPPCWTWILAHTAS